MSISMQRVFSCISLIPLVEYSLRPLSLISMLTSYFLSLARRYYAVMQLSIFILFSDLIGDGTTGNIKKDQDIMRRVVTCKSAVEDPSSGGTSSCDDVEPLRSFTLSTTSDSVPPNKLCLR